jgi:hypothetical protein
MDETYIKMCREAKEIQELWKPKIGNMYLDNMDNHLDCVCSDIADYLKDHPSFLDTDVWLPRQEDLQGIMIDKSIIPDRIIQHILTELLTISFFAPNIPEKNKISIATLISTMYTLFRKEWNPETEKWELIA